MNSPKSWVVYDAEHTPIAEDLTWPDAHKYMTRERLERGWYARCTFSKHNAWMDPPERDNVCILTTVASWDEPDEEMIKAWSEIMPEACVECGGPITLGEYDASGICSKCYFKEVGDAK